MIKFVFFLIGLATVCAGLIWLVAWIIGISNIEQNYILDFEILKRAIRDYKVTPRNKIVIENKFKTIYHYRCRNNDRLDELLTEFDSKFERVSTVKL